MAVTPDATLAIGESQSRSGPQTATLDGGSAGADYLVAVVNTGTAAGTKESFTLQATGVVAPVSALASQTSLSALPTDAGTALAAPDLGRAFEARVRASERRELRSRFAAAHSWLAERAPASLSAGGATRSLSPDPARRDGALPAGVKVGDILTVNVNGDDACANPVYHAVRVAAVGTRAVILADTLNPSGGFTSADFVRYAARFDTLVFPLDSAAFGAPTDIDANGHIGLVFTRAVNELTPKGSPSFVGGFTFSRDLFPVTGTTQLQACAASNQGEYFYLLAPDPTGVVNGNVRTAGFVDSNTTAVIAHEFQHLINAGRRIYVNNANDFEETWLDEGLAHIAEELLFYREAGLGPQGNLDTPKIRASERIRTAFNLDMTGNAGRYRSYLLAPSTSSPFAANDSLSTRGAAWSLLRYLADRSTGGDNAFFSRLVNSTTSGITNLRAVYGSDLTGPVRDWSASHAVDDVAAAAAELQQPSWNWHSIHTTLYGSYPLRIPVLAVGATTSESVVAGGSSFYRLGVPAGGSGSVSLGGASTTATTNLQLVIVRTR
jgi:hypothetical protein